MVLHPAGFLLFRDAEHHGIAYATIAITDDAVVSYTTFSPVSRILLAKKAGCVFSVIPSVSAGCCLQNPHFLCPSQTDTWGTVPCGVRTFLSVPFEMKLSGCLMHQLLLLDQPSSFLNLISFCREEIITTLPCPTWFLFQFRGSPIRLLPDFSPAVYV